MCFFFNDTATTEIYTLSLHDALPICTDRPIRVVEDLGIAVVLVHVHEPGARVALRSEEHTSELQSRLHLVCRLLLEKKKTATKEISYLNTLVAFSQPYLSANTILTVS